MSTLAVRYSSHEVVVHHRLTSPTSDVVVFDASASCYLTTNSISEHASLDYLLTTAEKHGVPYWATSVESLMHMTKGSPSILARAIRAMSDDDLVFVVKVASVLDTDWRLRDHPAARRAIVVLRDQVAAVTAAVRKTNQATLDSL